METKEKQKQDFSKAGWIIALILICLIVGFFIGAKFVKASPTWPLNKNQTCNMFNYSGQDCDLYWCNNFISNETRNCTYDLSQSTCNCIPIIIIVANNTNQTNSSINCSSANLTLSDWKTYCNSTNISSINCSSTNISLSQWQTYCNSTNLSYNCSDVNISMANFILYCNNTNQTNSTNFIGESCDFLNENVTLSPYCMSIKQYFDNRTITLRDALLDRIDNGTNNRSGNYVYGSTVNYQPWPPIYYVIIAAIVCGSFVYLGAVYAKKKSTEYKMIPRDAAKKPYKGNGPVGPDSDNLDEKLAKNKIKILKNNKKTIVEEVKEETPDEVPEKWAADSEELEE